MQGETKGARGQGAAAEARRIRTEAAPTYQKLAPQQTPQGCFCFTHSYGGATLLGTVAVRLHHPAAKRPGSSSQEGLETFVSKSVFRGSHLSSPPRSLKFRPLPTPSAHTHPHTHRGESASALPPVTISLISARN